MRLEDVCERGAWVLQIEIMGSFFGVGLNLLRSGIRCHRERRQSFELNKGFTVVKAIRWRVEWSIENQEGNVRSAHPESSFVGTQGSFS